MFIFILERQLPFIIFPWNVPQQRINVPPQQVSE